MDLKCSLVTVFLEPLFKEALGESYYSKLVPWRQELKLFIDQMEPPNARRQAA